MCINIFFLDGDNSKIDSADKLIVNHKLKKVNN